MDSRLSYVRKSSSSSQRGGMILKGRNGVFKAPETNLKDRIVLQNLLAMRRGHGRQFDKRLSNQNFQLGGYGGGDDPNQEGGGGFGRPLGGLLGHLERLEQKGGYGGGDDPNQEGGQIFSNSTLNAMGVKPLYFQTPEFRQLSRQASRRQKKRRGKNQSGGIFPAVAAVVPIAALLAKTIGLGALAGGAGFGAKKAAVRRLFNLMGQKQAADPNSYYRQILSKGEELDFEDEYSKVVRCLKGKNQRGRGRKQKGGMIGVAVPAAYITAAKIIAALAPAAVAAGTAGKIAASSVASAAVPAVVQKALDLRSEKD